MTSSKDDIQAKIRREEARLTELERQRDEARARLDALRDKLALPAVENAALLPSARQSIVPSTPAEKVRLFQQLFRGRPDVFPRLWENTRKQKKGYAPACFNEWVRGVCEKPRIRCAECPNQAFVPIDEQVILDHLQGRHTIGVYPLLEDESCWFLAADFDKACWKEDVLAFVEASSGFGLRPAVERSRSGNGAHVWFFFAAPVSASVARRMACFLLTETMTRRHQLGMESYDRLFPSQDTLPRGGFGNLIALPLQYEPRKLGNTVFVDERLEAHPDQWAFLASVERIEPSVVEAIAREAVRKRKVLGVRFPDLTAEEEPWARPPSGEQRRLRLPGPLPSSVRAVLAQRLFVDKGALPSPLLDEIRRLAAFQNPEFYKKQSMRLSTAGTPRVISCAEELEEYLALPRGCVFDVEALLAQQGSTLDLEDGRHDGDRLDVRFRGELTTIQAEAARRVFTHEIGLIVAPPGIGKTVLGTHLIAERGRNTLVLVHRRPLLDQWVAQLSMFLGVEAKDIGQIGGGKKKPTGRIDVAMIQSLVRKGAVSDLVASYGHVIVDECHHVPAFSFERVLSEVKARFVLGLTATRERRDGHHPILEMQLGPVRFLVDAKSRAAQRPFDHRLIVRETDFRLENVGSSGIQDIYRALSRSEKRNRLILDDVLHSLGEGRSPIVLTERRDHLDHLAGELRRVARHVVVLSGSRSAKERRESAARLAAIPDGEERVVLATGRYIGEGFDDARLDTLFLALPMSWKGTLVQYAGRLHRLHPGKTEVRVFDYVDHEVAVLMRMFEKRLRTYRAIGYARGEAPLGYSELRDEATIEWDEETLRQLDRQREPAWPANLAR